MSTMNSSNHSVNGVNHNHEIVPETVYQSVLYGDNLGTLKLSDTQLSFHTQEKVSVLPWNKVVKRQVLSTKSTGKDAATHKTKLILASGNEAIFTVEDRVSLEVLRDDLAERLATWRKNYKPAEDGVVNKTATQASGRRMSTPYRFVSANSARDLGANSKDKDDDNHSMMDRSLPAHLDGGGGRRSSRRESTPYRFVSNNNNNNNNNGTRKKKNKLEKDRTMDESTRSEPAGRRDSSYRYVSKPKEKAAAPAKKKKGKDDPMMDASTRSEPPQQRRESSGGSYRFVSKPKQDASPKEPKPKQKQRSSVAAGSSTKQQQESAPPPRRNTRRNSMPDVIYL